MCFWISTNIFGEKQNKSQCIMIYNRSFHTKMQLQKVEGVLSKQKLCEGTEDLDQ